MTHVFRLDETTAATHTERSPNGAVVEIRCRDCNGESTRLRLELTPEGVTRLADLVHRFTHAPPQPPPDRTPAAEPTSAGANTDQVRHVERYAVAEMTSDEVARLTSTLDADSERQSGAGSSWIDRVVVWKVPDQGESGSAQASFRVYLSPGAVRAAEKCQLRLETLGEVFRTDLPADRELLTGDPPLDWRDTAS